MRTKKWLLLIFTLNISVTGIEAQNICSTPSYYPNVLQEVSQYQIVNNSYGSMGAGQYGKYGIRRDIKRMLVQ